MIRSFIEVLIAVIVSVIAWAMFLVVGGLVLRVNWEVFMFGWRLLG